MLRKYKFSSFVKKNNRVIIIVVASFILFLFFVNLKTENKVVSVPSPMATVMPLKNPYQGSIQIERQMLRDLDDDSIDLKIINIIGNYSYVSEYAKAPGIGGGWCVLKKENQKWSQLFCSQDSAHCSLYDEYKLPKWLLGECSI